MSDSNNSAYSILSVPKTSSEKDIKEAYVRMVKKYDPEKHTDRFMVVQRAYDRLRNTKSRAQEDVYTYNSAEGEYLFQPEEKSLNETPPSETELVQGRAQYKQDVNSEEAKQKLCRLLFRRAHASVKRKQLSDAIRDWNEVLDIDPSHIRARNNLALASAALGHSYALHGLHDEAIELWERALQMNPDSTPLLQNLALVSEKAGDPQRAGKYWAETVHRWKALLEKDSENEYLRQCIVEALNHHGEYVEEHELKAKKQAAREATTSTSAPRTQQPTARATPTAKPQEQQPQALPSSSRVKLPSRGTSSGSVPKLPAAGSGSQQQAIPAGIERYREIVKLNPDDFDTHYQLCNKLMEAQLWEEAKNELMTLARKHPKNTEVLNLLGWTLLNSGQKDLAFNAWKKSLSIDPSNSSTREQLVRAHLSMGKAFRNKGLFTQALVHFKQLLSYMPKSAEVHLEIAATYDMKGDVRSAAQEYNRVVAIDPKNKLARKALNDLRMKR